MSWVFPKSDNDDDDSNDDFDKSDEYDELKSSGLID